MPTDGEIDTETSHLMHEAQHFGPLGVGAAFLVGVGRKMWGGLKRDRELAEQHGVPYGIWIRWPEQEKRDFMWSKMTFEEWQAASREERRKKVELQKAMFNSSRFFALDVVDDSPSHPRK